MGTEKYVMPCQKVFTHMRHVVTRNQRTNKRSSFLLPFPYFLLHLFFMRIRIHIRLRAWAFVLP